MWLWSGYYGAIIDEKKTSKTGLYIKKKKRKKSILYRNSLPGPQPRNNPLATLLVSFPSNFMADCRM